jgi:peptide-methionine (R)-S-oxide reductase
MTKQTTRTDAEWKALLAEKGAEPLAFEVTRHAATERPFTGKYEDHWTPGQLRLHLLWRRAVQVGYQV